MKILGVISFTIFLLSLAVLIFNFVVGKIFKKEKFSRLIKKNVIITSIFFFISMITIALDDSVDTGSEKDTRTEKQIVQEVKEEVKEVKEVKKEDIKKEDVNEKNMKLEGNLKLSNENRKLKVELSTNSPDGTIFIIFIATSNFDSMSEKVTIKSGKAEKVFDIPKKWGDTSVGVSAVMTFNNPEIIQPEETKEFYKNVSDSLEIKSIDIPSTIAVQQAKEKFYNDSKKELIKISGGLILDISEYQENEDLVATVVFDDVWYSIPKYEKERIIDSIDTSLKNLIISTKKLEEHKVGIIYKDSYGKKLIKRKMFGGIEIVE